MVVVLVIVVAAIGLFLAKASRPRWGDIVITHRVDLGVIEEEGKVGHRLLATNSLSSPITISAVHASCGCLASRVACGTAAPGQEVAVDIEIDASQRTGVQQLQVRADTNQGAILWVIGATLASHPYILPLEAHSVIRPKDERAPVEFVVSALSKHGRPEAICRIGDSEVPMECQQVAPENVDDVLQRYKLTCVIALTPEQHLLVGDISVHFGLSACELHAKVVCARRPAVNLSPLPVIVSAGEAINSTVTFDCSEEFVLEAVVLPDGSRHVIGRNQGSFSLETSALGIAGSSGTVCLEVSGGGREELPFLIMAR